MQFQKITRKVSRLTLAFILLTAQMTPFFAFNTQRVGASGNSNQDKVEICHATNSATNPYEFIEVDESAVDGVGNGDHYLEHKGPVATSVAVAQAMKTDKIVWGDIIPPVGNHSGLNWTTIGQAIYNAECSLTTIELKKVTSPTADSGKFNLTVDPDDSNVANVTVNNVGNGGTTGVVYINSSKDVVLKEAEGTATDLANYTSTLVCVDGNKTILTRTSSQLTGNDSRQAELDKSDIDSGSTIVCTFTNTKKTGTLIVNKVLNQDNGGNATADDFSFVITNHNNGNPIMFESDASNSIVLPVGTYSVTETSAEGYTTTYKDCTNISITAGTSKTCTITNTSKPASLTLTKVVENDNGGNAMPDDFKLTVNGKLVISGEKKTYLAGSPLTINETQLSGYSFVSITGDEACPSVLGGTLTLLPGQDVSCVITNDDAAPTLTVIKNVINDNGGTLGASAFGIKINNSGVVFGTGISNGSMMTYSSSSDLDSNAQYTLHEADTAGYAEGSWSCSNEVSSDTPSVLITLNEGQNVTCTITNNDIAPQLKLIKIVVNNNGGTEVASAWTLIAQAGDNTPIIETNGTTVEGSDGLKAETPFTQATAGIFYTLSESGPEGYSSSDWTCEGGSMEGGAVALALGTQVSCSVTNYAKPATIRVHKTVVNDNGGTSVASDFGFVLNGEKTFEFEGDSDDSTVEISVSSGTHTITESSNNGYEASYEGCDEIEAKNGQTYDCYITNDDIAPRVYVTKYVYNKGCFMNREFDQIVSGCDNEQSFNFSLINNEQLYANFSLYPGAEYSTVNGLDAGWVTVEEEELENWRLLNAQCYYNNDDEDGIALGTTFEVEIGKTYYCEFVNEKAGSVIVTKFNDANKNGEWDENEVALPGWDMTLEYSSCEESDDRLVSRVNSEDEESVCDETNLMTETTNSEGEAIFNGLYRNFYTVNEVMKSGWTQTAIYCEQNHDIELSRIFEDTITETVEEETNTFYLHSAETVNCYIGNYKTPEVVTPPAVLGAVTTVKVTPKVTQLQSTGTGSLTTIIAGISVSLLAVVLTRRARLQ